jgi:hypothetical protein
MQVKTEIRRKVLVKKVPKRQICRNYNISFHTLAKMLENVETVKIVAQGHLVATTRAAGTGPHISLHQLRSLSDQSQRTRSE